MARTSVAKNVMCSAYLGDVAKLSLHSADPGSTGANEISGGSPAYARVAPGSVNGPTNGLGSISATFDVGAGTTLGGFGLWDASGNFLDGGSFASPPSPPGSQSTFALTVQYQQN